MEVSKIVFATYDLNKNNTKIRGFEIKRNDENIFFIKQFKETNKITCSNDDNPCDTCKKEENCNIYFNNYSGIFIYNDGENIKQILVIHRKLCKLLLKYDDSCQNDCTTCNEVSASNKEIVFERYNYFFEKFTFEIIDKLKEHLPFQIISPINSYIKEMGYNDNTALKLILIYQKRDEIRGSINHILSNPHRKIVEKNNICRYDEVTYIDSDVILDIILNPQRLVSVNGGCIQNLYCPNQVMQYYIEESFDTLENRYIKAFLKNLIEMIIDCEKFIKNKIQTQENKKILEELKNLRDDIEQSLRHYAFNEVGELTQLPSNSQVLMKQAGYRELFILDRLLNVTILPTFTIGFDEALSIKSMDILWELFVMVKIIEALKSMGYEISEQKWDEKTEKDTEYDYASFVFDKDKKIVNVSYQESIKVGTTGNSTVRPDFLLKYPEKKRRIVIDAKFMIKDYVPTDSISKYLTHKISLEDSNSYEKLSKAVFAACIEDRDKKDEGHNIKSYTHLFNEKSKINHKSLESLIKCFLKLEECNEIEIKDDEQYIGYIPIELPRGG